MVQARRRAGLDSPHIDRTNRPIDLVHLARQTLGDPGLENEVLRMFERQVNLYFEPLREASDPYEIALGLHTLKGAAQGVGAMTVAVQAKAAEEEFALNGRVADETLEDLAMAVAEVSEYILLILED